MSILKPQLLSFFYNIILQSDNNSFKAEILKNQLILDKFFSLEADKLTKISKEHMDKLDALERHKEIYNSLYEIQKF